MHSAAHRLASILVLAAHGAGKLRIAKQHAEGPIHDVADAHLEMMKTAVMHAFNKARGQKTPAAAARVVENTLLELLPAALLKIVKAGGDVAVKKFHVKAASVKVLAGPVNMRFDATNPRAIKWAREHAAELAKGISDTTRDDVKEAIAASLEGEFSRDETERSIRDAVGDDIRAELIARTETMMAANEGQREGWSQAAEAGLLPEDAVRVWIATEDACPECDELDGETAELEGEYPGDGGDGPPLHPNCRCTEGIGQ